MKKQHDENVAEHMIKDMFWNLRLGVAAITPVMVLYYILLAIDSSISNHLTFASITGLWIVILNVYFFLGEDWVKDFERRTFVANAVITGAVTTIGIGFLLQVPNIKDPQILLTTYGLAIGVLGAAAFFFSCNKYTYVLFGVGWISPLVGWLLLSPNVGQKVFGMMFVFYVAAMAFLSLKDYNRRVALIKALQTVTNLKKQQDGDYYLTSLLIKPLAINTAHGQEGMKIDFFSDQKKKFSFKDRSFEIGGDINIAHSLALGGKECSVILNADAMGKSIQGAGGALVLGSVFQSIMDRTRARSELSNVSPERWMKETFIQLQRVFESFEGSMLVSVFFCIIENASGAMYWVNAEHPQAVLLRGGKASFLPFDKQFRKLGTPDMSSKVSLSTYMLAPGDVLIVGSDGRDDIDLKTGAAHGRTINEDEYLFLRSVEKAGGDLARVRDEIASHGEITDDLTMIRVEFKGSRALQDSGKLRQNAVSAFKSRRFPEAIEKALPYLSLQPLDNQLVYLAAVASFRMGQYGAGIDFAERLRMREPENARYLALLIELYLKSNNRIAARKLLDAMRFAHPTHVRLAVWEAALAA